MSQEDNQKLQDHFDKGWEYVDSICQACSTAKGDYSTTYGPVSVILKKEDKVML